MSQQAPARRAAGPGTRAPEAAPRNLPARPLVVVLAGYPLWWALGLGPLALMLGAVVMAVLLARHRDIRVPAWFGWWLLFLVWVVLSLAMLGVDPPGTVPDDVLARAPVALFRLGQYLTITVFLVYVVTLRREVFSSRKLSWLLGLVFVYAVAGGWAALAVPTLEFTSPVEFLLPDRISSNLWVASMVHPSVAQVQDFIGFELGRPSAPFGFTNLWGANLAILAPWFILGWVVLARGWRRLLGVVIGAAAVVPAVLSVNRGLWVGLAVMVAATVVYAIIYRRPGIAVAIVAAGVLALGAIAASPLSNVVEARLANQHSNDVRTFTSEKAIEASGTSPVLGLGTTRTAVGSVRSIAVGKSPDCPRCGNTPLGQNGQIFMVLVGQGVVGVILFYAMFLRGLVQSLRPGDIYTMVAGISLSIGLVLTLFYDMLMSPVLFWAMGLAMVWREGVDREPDGGDPPS